MQEGILRNEQFRLEELRGGAQISEAVQQFVHQYVFTTRSRRLYFQPGLPSSDLLAQTNLDSARFRT